MNIENAPAYQAEAEVKIHNDFTTEPVRLEVAMAAKGMTRKDLAKRLGVSACVIGNWILEYCKPNHARRLEVEKIFGRPIYWSDANYLKTNRGREQLAKHEAKMAAREAARIEAERAALRDKVPTLLDDAIRIDPSYTYTFSGEGNKPSASQVLQMIKRLIDNYSEASNG